MGLFGSDGGDEVDEKAQSLVDGAKHDSVNIERLTKLKPGRMSRYLHDDPLIEYLNENEQPHYILAARSKTPSVAGSTQQEAKRLQQEVPEQYGTGMVMHMITEGRWVMVASNSSEGDQMLEISFEELTDADYSTGNSSHSIDLRLDSASIDIPIANLYNEDDIEAAYSYIEAQLPESDEKGSVNSTETGANTEDDERELSDMELRLQRSKIANNLGEDAVAEYKDGEYEIPEDYIVQETRFSSWNEFVSQIPPETEKTELEDTQATLSDTGDDGDNEPEEPKSFGERVGEIREERSNNKNSKSKNFAEEDYEAVKEYLDSDEEPEYILKGASISIEGGNSEDRKGSLTGTARTAVTEKRVLTVVPQKIMGEDTKSVSYEDMGGVDFNKGLMNKYLKFQSHGRTYKIHTRDAEKTKKAIKYIRDRKQKLEKEKQSSGGPENDPTEQLKNIKELHDQGVLTDEEFEEKKSDLLDKI